MAMSERKQIIINAIKLNVNKSNSEIAKILKDTFPEMFENVATDSVRKRIGEYRLEFDLYADEDEMDVEEKSTEPKKVLIKDTDIEIDKDVWLKKEFENTNLRSTVSEKDKIIKVLRNELYSVSEKLDYVLDLKNYNPHKFKITPNQDIKSESTAILCASDWHIEEKIDASTVNGLNEFNLEIADQSAKNFFSRGVRLIEVFGKDTDINNIVLWLGGDFISGYIHEELMESNYLTPIEATLVVMDMLISGINYILKNTKCRLTIPTSVGNHCLEENTEILTTSGWKRMADLTEDDIIASFKKDSGEISFDKVVALTKFSEHGGYQLSSNFKDELVTKDHNLVIDGEFVKTSKYQEVKNSKFRHFGNVPITEPTVKFTDDELRLYTWIVADATLVNRAKYGETGFRVQFKLSKQRKIDSLRELLDRMEIPYTFKEATKYGVNKLQPYYIRIYGEYAKKMYNEWFNGNKEFGKNLLNLTRKQLDVVLNTLTYTDGRYLNNILEWSTTSKNDADIIQALCVMNGIKCKYKMKIYNINDHSFPNSIRKPSYIMNVYINESNFRDSLVKREYIDEAFNFVGVTSVNGTIIVRRNGIVSFTGNSRNSEKRKISTENKNSYEYLMYHMLRRHFNENERVNFIIDDGYLTYIDIYDYKIRFHHGHAMNYGGGVGGVTIPVAKAIAQWDKETKAYLDIFGHFHTLMMDTGTSKFVLNGSLVGYSPFALRIKAPFEQPKQAFILIDKQRGKTISAPIFVR